MKRVTDTNLSYATEQELSRVICGLHPHKNTLANYRVKSVIIRAGWGYFKSLCERDTECA